MTEEPRLKATIFATIVGLSLSLGLPLAAQGAPPRQTATAIAEKIRALYFDPERGDAVADRLEAEAARGAFDSLTDPRDLATALSTFLNPSDAHFVVVYSDLASRTPPASQPSPQPSPSTTRADPALAERQTNHGFRRVEILPGNVGVLDLGHFAHIEFKDPGDPARRTADAALSFLADTDAIIIDLRDNGGGAPSMVGYLTSAFTARDAQIYNVFHGRDGTESEAPTVFHPSPRLAVPLYVLVSGRTGSAAEAFPYTLQAARRATIVGEASAGAANPGGMESVGEGFSVFVSQGSPRNPLTGRNWEGVGVMPDLASPSDQAQTLAYSAALRGILKADPTRRAAQWALDALAPELADPDRWAYVGVYGEIRITEVEKRLRLTRGRRPALSLQRLDRDLYTVVGDPGRRVRFLRSAGGAVEALEQHLASGGSSRNLRTD